MSHPPSVSRPLSAWLAAIARALRPLYMARGSRLIEAAKDNDTAGVLALLHAGANPRTTLDTGEAFSHPDAGLTALHWGVRHGNLDMVHALLQAGASPNAQRAWGESPTWEWLEKHKDAAECSVEGVNSQDLDVGIALFSFGASLDLYIPPFQSTTSMASSLSLQQKRMVAKVQSMIASQTLQAATPPTRPTRPRQRL